MSNGLSSIDLIAARVDAQREFQFRLIDGLDSKSGIVLGFAGVLVALADGSDPLSIAGKLLSVSATLTALWSFLPRRYPVLDTRELRDLYLRAESHFTKLHLLDSQIGLEEQGAALLDLKTFRLKLALGFLVVGVLLTAAGIITNGGGP